MLFNKSPAMRFYPTKELEGDPTNWWGPNPEAVKGMLKAVGFRKVEIVSADRHIYNRLYDALIHKVKGGRSFLQMIQRDRMVFHALR
jgi:hypothetical protein